MKRTREQVIWDFVKGWLQKAEGDLRAAEHLLDVRQEDYFTSAFHAQQAAEKFLKAFLVCHQVAFTKTHDIQRLLNLASQVVPSLGEKLSSALILTPFGIEFRYPGEDVADLNTAKKATSEARRVKAAVMEQLSDYLKQGRPS